MRKNRTNQEKKQHKIEQIQIHIIEKHDISHFTITMTMLHPLNIYLHVIYIDYIYKR